MMRLAVDVGGTFTDLVVQNAGELRHFKSPTTPDDPTNGLLHVVGKAATEFGTSTRQLLSNTQLLIHATTIATNAILTGKTGKTAFLTTAGHPDILLLREGGRVEPFNNTVAFPEPYVPRRLTFEVPERVCADGSILTALDSAAVVRIARALEGLAIEAVGVCFLWAIVNPIHECQTGELLERYLPGVPYSLSHQINPSVREYRRASSTCIDASLKPLMVRYLTTLESRLRGAGFSGRLLSATSQASVMDLPALARTPIHSINCGPAMAPVAGRHYATLNCLPEPVVVADTGGTSFDVSLVRRSRIPWTRESWLGERLRGHMTGFPAVDVRSVGAGGGSVAEIDQGGMLTVGPQSAGANPGPACYGRGGNSPTVTDAALVLGFIDPGNFLGGDLMLDIDAAERVICEGVARPLGLEIQSAASAIIDVVTQNMTHAIERITIDQGIDPRDAVLVGGGGAAGLNSVQIARRLGCPTIVIPSLGATLSAVGAQLSDLSAEFSATCVTSTKSFDFSRFFEQYGADALAQRVEFSVEGRYPHQVWEIELPLAVDEFGSQEDVKQLVRDFHALHEAMFAIADIRSSVEVLVWRARAHCTLVDRGSLRAATDRNESTTPRTRGAYFTGIGSCRAQVQNFAALTVGEKIAGPAIVESNLTTVVLDPGCEARRTEHGDLLISPR